eukprot:TRINITY_DN18578_c0_g1_i1.p1 TRINITY_DN18578_c0_g1~~TRINITY_DN18578_c0_g1_i1.p1  ORF type:complete len:630 (-),score=98.30 TRINITY_DN18578_c0_g1_i1:100-1989(-)
MLASTLNAKKAIPPLSPHSDLAASPGLEQATPTLVEGGKHCARDFPERMGELAGDTVEEGTPAEELQEDSPGSGTVNEEDVHVFSETLSEAHKFLFSHIVCPMTHLLSSRTCHRIFCKHAASVDYSDFLASLVNFVDTYGAEHFYGQHHNSNAARHTIVHYDEVTMPYSTFAVLMQCDLSQLEVSSKGNLLKLRAALDEESKILDESMGHRYLVKMRTRAILDVAPAFVIFTNALVVGLSADFENTSSLWDVLEVIFSIIFSLEAFLRFKLDGCKIYFCGPGSGWNYFDLFCLTCAYIDLVFTYVSYAQGTSSADLSSYVLLRILRLVRVCRVIRMMRFGAVKELRVIIEGIFSGIRVLFWAIMLLFFTVYIVAVCVRILLPEYEEFASVSAAIMTTFRCFTGSCDSADGLPLQDILRINHGFGFTIVYMAVFLFVSLGIFNLIMAVFLDSVLSEQTARNLEDIGSRTEEMEIRISNVIATLAAGERLDKQESSNSVCELIGQMLSKMFRGKKDSRRTKVTAAEQFERSSNLSVSREDFNEWLEYPEMIDLFKFCKIETATRHALFDVLDADVGGELQFGELINGLMRLRGPVTKADIISIDLKMGVITKLIDELWQNSVNNAGSRQST